jgi:hypothetical protein
MLYRVLVDDNFHSMDEDARYELGTFATLDAAIAAARALVDDYLETARKPGMTARELFENYTMFGEDPFIVGLGQPGESFSAWEYAKRRCEELCGLGDDSGG